MINSTCIYCGEMVHSHYDEWMKYYIFACARCGGKFATSYKDCLIEIIRLRAPSPIEILVSSVENEARQND